MRTLQESAKASVYMAMNEASEKRSPFVVIVYLIEAIDAALLWS